MAPKPTRIDIRRQERDEVYAQRKQDAMTGRDLLDAVLALLRAELTDLAVVNPHAEDQACRRLAADIEPIAYETREEVDRERKTRLALQEQARRQRRR